METKYENNDTFELESAASSPTSLTLEQQSQMILSLTAEPDPSVHSDDDENLLAEPPTKAIDMKADEANVLLDDAIKAASKASGRASARDSVSSHRSSASSVPGAFRAVHLSGRLSLSSPEEEIGANADENALAASQPTSPRHPCPSADAGDEEGDEEAAVSSDVIVSAVRVLDDDKEQDVEDRVRQRILNEAVKADVVATAVEAKQSGDDQSTGRKRNCWIALLVACLLFAGLVAVGVGLSVSKQPAEEGQPDKEESKEPVVESLDETSLDGDANSEIDSVDTMIGPPKNTLETVLERGVLRCGVYNDMPGFSFYNETSNTLRGFNVEFCRAAAAATFGDATKVEWVLINAANRFQMLASGEVDMISQSATVTMERDIREQTTQSGFTFSYPFYFSGLVFGGHPEYVECADKLDPFNGICRQLRVCVVIGTTQEAILSQLLGGSAIVRFETPTDAIQFMNDGTCNAIAAEAITLNPTRLKQIGLFQGLNFVLGENTFSRDPLSLVTRDDDPEWPDLVNSITKILYAAEALGLTKNNVESRMVAEYKDQLDEKLLSRIIHVVSTIGNYEEAYTREAEMVVDRGGANLLNVDRDTGLVYSYPFGNVHPDDGSGIVMSPVMEVIQKRGFVKCGIPLVEDDQFAAYDEITDSYSGLDVEFCRALAAGLFVGDTSRVQFTEVDPSSAFQILAADDGVDVLAGQQVTLTNEFSEPTTAGKSFSFSDPYFYDPSDGRTRALATRRDDNTWSSFVYWTLTALIFAEEMGITSSTAIAIPPVSLFGDSLLQCFRDSVASVGNYGEIYDRTIGTERSGANQLNTAPYGPQQVGYPLL